MSPELDRNARLAPSVRRCQLLDAALAVVDEGGFAGTTVEAVARHAGVTRPMVYDLFGDLDGLLLAMVELEQQRAVATIAGFMPADPAGRDPDALLLAGLEGFLEAVRAQPRRWRLVLLPPDGAPQALRGLIADARARAADQLAELLTWALERRGGPDGLDLVVLSRLLIAAAEDAARLVLSRPVPFPPSRLSATARSLLSLLPASAAPEAA